MADLIASYLGVSAGSQLVQILSGVVMMLFVVILWETLLCVFRLVGGLINGR